MEGGGVEGSYFEGQVLVDRGVPDALAYFLSQGCLPQVEIEFFHVGIDGAYWHRNTHFSRPLLLKPLPDPLTRFKISHVQGVFRLDTASTNIIVSRLVARPPIMSTSQKSYIFSPSPSLAGYFVEYIVFSK